MFKVQVFDHLKGESIRLKDICLRLQGNVRVKRVRRVPAGRRHHAFETQTIGARFLHLDLSRGSVTSTRENAEERCQSKADRYRPRDEYPASSEYCQQCLNGQVVLEALSRFLVTHRSPLVLPRQISRSHFCEQAADLSPKYSRCSYRYCYDKTDIRIGIRFLP